MTIEVAPGATTTPAGTAGLRRLHGAAGVRIAFGVIWAIDAVFKFLPGFVHGETLDNELGAGADIQTPSSTSGSSSGTVPPARLRQRSPSVPGSSRSGSRSACCWARSATWSSSAVPSGPSASGRRPKVSTCRGPSRASPISDRRSRTSWPLWSCSTRQPVRPGVSTRGCGRGWPRSGWDGCAVLRWRN